MSQSKCPEGETKQFFGGTYTCVDGVWRGIEGAKIIDGVYIAPPPKKKFFSPYGKSFWISSAVYWSAVAADIQNTRILVARGTHREGNPLLSNGRGGISVPKAVLLSVPGYGFSLWVEKKNPKGAALGRFFSSGLRAAVIAYSRR